MKDNAVRNWKRHSQGWKSCKLNRPWQLSHLIAFSKCTELYEMVLWRMQIEVLILEFIVLSWWQSHISFVIKMRGAHLFYIQKVLPFNVKIIQETLSRYDSTQIIFLSLPPEWWPVCLVKLFIHYLWRKAVFFTIPLSKYVNIKGLYVSGTQNIEHYFFCLFISYHYSS